MKHKSTFRERPGAYDRGAALPVRAPGGPSLGSSTGTHTPAADRTAAMAWALGRRRAAAAAPRLVRAVAGPAVFPDPVDEDHLPEVVRLPFGKEHNGPVTLVVPPRRLHMPWHAIPDVQELSIAAMGLAGALEEDPASGELAFTGTTTFVVEAPFNDSLTPPSVEELIEFDAARGVLRVCPSLFRAETELFATEIAPVPAESTHQKRKRRRGAQQQELEEPEVAMSSNKHSLINMLRHHMGEDAPPMELMTPDEYPRTAQPVHDSSSSSVLMVAPTAFAVNEQASADNTFMPAGDGAGATKRSAVLREFAALHRLLTEELYVNVELFTHDEEHGTPDAVFPNNWFSTHRPLARGGRPVLVLYPMKCPNRRREVRDDMLHLLEQASGPDHRLVDLREAASDDFENAPEDGVPFLEGTGSIVMDRATGVAYVSVSQRADPALAERWRRDVNDAAGTDVVTEIVPFVSHDAQGGTVYHTNVMMMVGSTYAIVCLEAISDANERKTVADRLVADGREVVPISIAQMHAMAGNALEVVHGMYGVPYLVMSTQGRESLTDEQVHALERHVAGIAHADIRTLESLGGGSARCTLGEIF